MAYASTPGTLPVIAQLPVVLTDPRSIPRENHIRVRFNFVRPDGNIRSFVIGIPRLHNDASTFAHVLDTPLKRLGLEGKAEELTYTLYGNEIFGTACLRDDDIVVVLPGIDQCASNTLLLESKRIIKVPKPSAYGSTIQADLSTTASKAWDGLGKPRLAVGANASVTVLRSEETGEMMLRLEGEVDCSLHDRNKNMVIDMIKVTLGLNKKEAPHLGYFPRPCGQVSEQERKYSFGWSRSIDLDVSAGVTATGAPPPAPPLTPSLGASLGLRTERTRNQEYVVTFHKTRLSHVPLLTLWNGGDGEYSGVTFVKKIDKIIPADDPTKPVSYTPLSSETKIPKDIKPTDLDDWSVHGINRDFRFGASFDVSKVAGLGAAAEGAADKSFAVVVCVEVYACEKGGKAYLYSNGRWIWEGLTLDNHKMVLKGAPATVAATPAHHYFSCNPSFEWQTHAWAWSEAASQAKLLWNGLRGKIVALLDLVNDDAACEDSTMKNHNALNDVGPWWSEARRNLRAAATLAKNWSDDSMTGWYTAHGGNTDMMANVRPLLQLLTKSIIDLTSAIQASADGGDILSFITAYDGFLTSVYGGRRSRTASFNLYNKQATLAKAVTEIGLGYLTSTPEDRLGKYPKKIEGLIKLRYYRSKMTSGSEGGRVTPEAVAAAVAKLDEADKKDLDENAAKAFIDSLAGVIIDVEGDEVEEEEGVNEAVA
eukprot:TRINITY_DN3101_c0_g1_i1.p1 TRINITY_DN3101_c0_g1~~TRINITY_DN3101_c0_g1_i1.p1  ORF type:complete len:723 (-),score=161.01 TRINITY_DN3101_c0_g1_i1:277-2400(-)